MRRVTAFALLLAICLGSVQAQQMTYDSLRNDAERLYAEGSYALAREVYERASRLELAAGERRWVAFRLADTLWRAQAGTATPDSTRYDEAIKQLEALVRDISRVEDRDRVWAEVHESIGDFHWTRRESRNWWQAWQYYEKALDWWAGSSAVDLARNRYLKIVWTLAEPPGMQPYERYGYYGNNIPLPVLENALRIARAANDQARARYLIATTLMRSGDLDGAMRVPAEFEAALAPGKAVDWYDDALFQYAQFMENYGPVTETDDGQLRREQDYVTALGLYRRLVTEFRKGETQYFDQAQSQIRNILGTTVNVAVPNVFLPGSEIGFSLAWRNATRVDLALYRIDLPADVRFPADESYGGEWISRVPLAGRAPVKAWAKQTEDMGDHRPGNEMVRVDGSLPPGAYVLEAKAGTANSRDLVLVTDVSLVLKTSNTQALAYVCNALTGAPVAGARVALWEFYYDGGSHRARRLEGTTTSEGLAPFRLAERREYSKQFFASAALGERQAFSGGDGNGHGGAGRGWRIYAYTDRPAYRPGEEAQWKLLARTFADGVYATPANQAVEYQIDDPRGAKVAEGKSTLNAFGSAWGSLKLTEAMPLGEYRVTFWTAGRGETIGQATLLRLEEYKLPEFKVEVKTPEEKGKKKAFRLGEKVEVTVQADYYFGGAVANATVEVVVYQNPFYRWWFPPREYPWFYEDIDPRPYSYGGQGPIVKRETLKTDAEGKAALSFDTPRYQGQEFEYKIEARVTDSSRREIVSSGSVRVTRQRYYVYPRVDHYLYKPQDRVDVKVKALDANDQPVATTGTIKVTRDYWFEIWVDPTGREVKGPELARMRGRAGVFPPSTPPGGRPWVLKFQGYEHDDVLTRSVTTDAEGVADFAFTPEREGYYRVAWSSKEKGATPITGETAVWVVTNTFKAGQTAPVMLAVEGGDRYVLFGVEAEDLFSYRLVHVTGNAKLVEVPISEQHVPNTFLSAVMVADRQMHVDTKQVVVPPLKNFLTVDVKADSAQYQPRDEGTLTVTTRDADGRPVAAEVGLGFVDESVFYIQQDYAGDPRRTYFGSKRPHLVRTQSTFQYKSYARLVAARNNLLLDEREAKDEDKIGKRDLRGAGFGAEFGRQAAAPAAAVAVTAGAEADDQSSRFRRDGVVDVVSEQKVVVGAKEALLSKSGRNELHFGDVGPGQEPAVQVRSDFRSTIFWQPDVVTDASGQATVKVKFPDSLTTWRATARAASSGNQFGIATGEARTKQPLIVRLQAPRFFLEGDTVTVSAVINNNTDAGLSVAAALAAEGVDVTGLVVDGKATKGEAGPVSVPANGEARVDWLVAVRKAGEAKLRVEGRGGRYADAMERTFPVFEHGLEKFVARSGKAKADETTVTIDIPAERKKESTSLTVQIAPSMAVTMLDALPYLIDYPYGCTEQTMSRFLPAAIVAKTLADLGLRPEDVEGRVFGGIEQATASVTHPKGKRPLGELAAITKQSLDRLYDFQHSDGGWGWWKEGDSDHYMTAYVVWGMSMARQAGIDVRADVLDRGAQYLDKEIVEEENAPDVQAWMLHALAVYDAVKEEKASEFQTKAFENLWAKRDQLNAYTRALLALAAHNFGDATRAMTLVRNLQNGVEIDRSPDTSVVVKGGPKPGDAALGTAHWGKDGIWWRWSEGGVEATSFALRAILAIDPKSARVEPVTNWLVKNRRGAQWSNTRDTAIAVFALNDYLRASGELGADFDYELFVNDTSVASRHVSTAEVLSAPSRFAVDQSLVRDGANRIRIVRRGAGAVYFSAEAKFFSLEEPVAPAGNEIFVRRDYFKLVGRETLLKGFVYDRVPLRDGESVRSGERVETVLTIEAKNDYEYLVFEDLKPAGFEAVEVRSGEALYAKQLKAGAVAADRTGDATDYAGGRRWVYKELRDRKVALFLDKLPQGVWEIRYDMRAEVPGSFHALPVMGHAMYVPEIRCNGAEARVTVMER
jgi:uncharacterized protein YfaS (alpha-2-macroglobulin family)/tetratricopeptide (TPR) repeat protein